jgi:hypothetical protein
LDEKIIALLVIPLIVAVMLHVYTNTDDASTESITESITVSALDTWIPLEKQYIWDHSEVVTNATGVTLVRDVDYMIDYNSGSIFFCDGGCA